MCFNQRGDISTLNGSSLKLIDKFTYLRSSVSSTETDINTWLAKSWTAINNLSVIWKSDLTDKMKRSFFQAAVVSILLYGCTTWTLTKRMEKKIDGNYARILQAILNKKWRQHPSKQQLYGHLPPITKTIQVRWTRHVGHRWRSKDELISDVLLWTLSHGRAKAGRPARTYLQQLRADMGCSSEDLSEVMDDREGWWERVSADWMTWWRLCNVANLLHSLLMWLIVSSLSPHNLHFLFCCVLFIFSLIQFVLMAFFGAAIRSDSIFLIKFPVFSHVIWVVHIPFVRIVKFKLLTQFPVGHLPHPVVSLC